MVLRVLKDQDLSIFQVHTVDQVSQPGEKFPSASLVMMTGLALISIKVLIGNQSAALGMPGTADFDTNSFW